MPRNLLTRRREMYSSQTYLYINKVTLIDEISTRRSLEHIKVRVSARLVYIFSYIFRVIYIAFENLFIAFAPSADDWALGRRRNTIF